MKKRYLLLICALVCALSAVFYLPARAAIEIDGVVGNLEWADRPKTEISGLMCGISDAAVRSVIQRGDPNRVAFGFTAHAPDVTAQSPVGAALFVAGQRIARWQQGVGVEYDAESYFLRGEAYVPENDALNSFSFELELGCKTAAALQALSTLQVQLYDPQGEPSRRIGYPIAAPAVETTAPTTTTTKPTTTTTAKETTTKAPTTTKETTTKAPTTTKETTTKPPTNTKETTATAPVTTKESTTTQTTTTTTATTKTTTRARTTEPPYTMPPGWATSAAKRQAASSAAATVSAAVPAQGTPVLPAATAPLASASTQLARQSSSVIWYTVMITDTTADAALWTYAPVGEEAYVAQTELTAAQLQQAQSQPAAQRSWLFYGLAALLFALALVMIVFWLRAQRAEGESEQAKEKEEA
jgi:hypothetical protein